ncbi:MAG TPA: tetratricopeptide repeat protein [Opitutaceae bacterium]|nr:tetratricopeptide repeat protein [Opitutaceae bacterium]
MSAKGTLVVAAVAIAAAGAGAYVVKHSRDRGAEQAIAQAVPQRPNLASWPQEMVRLVSTCEDICRGGTKAERVEALTKLADLYHANGFLPEAIQAYRGLIAAEPDNARWLHRVASIYDSYGNLEEAVKLWRAASDKAPDYLPVRIHLADALVKLRQPAEAQTQYESVLKNDDANAYAQLGLARIDLENGRKNEARERLERITQSKNNLLGADLLVAVYDQLGMTREADQMRSQTRLAAGYTNIPDPWIDDMYDACFDPYRLLLLGSAADFAGKPDKAREYLEKAVRIAPNYAMAEFQLATHYDRSGNLTTALEHAKKSIALAQDFSDGWLEMISLYRRTGDDVTADRLLTEALSRAPNSPALHMEHGRRLAKAGNVADAIEQFRIATKLRPEEAEAHVEIAKLFLASDRVSEGVAELEAALRAEPGYPLAISALTLHWIMSGDQVKASAMFKKVEHQPRIPENERARLAQAFRDRFGQSP